jgi:hypothetical protein
MALVPFSAESLLLANPAEFPEDLELSLLFASAALCCMLCVYLPPYQKKTRVYKLMPGISGLDPVDVSK